MVRKSGKKKRPPRISDSEWIVMKPFWDNGAMAARDLYDAVSAAQDWSYTTVKTMLSRLVKKGALDYTQVGNSYLYSPCFSRDEMVRTEVKSFSHRVLDGSLKPFLVGFFDGRNPSPGNLVDTLPLSPGGGRSEQVLEDIQAAGAPVVLDEEGPARHVDSHHRPVIALLDCLDRPVPLPLIDSQTILPQKQFAPPRQHVPMCVTDSAVDETRHGGIHSGQGVFVHALAPPRRRTAELVRSRGSW